MFRAYSISYYLILSFSGLQSKLRTEAKSVFVNVVSDILPILLFAPPTMFARSTLVLGRAAAKASSAQAPPLARNMATLKELEVRLKSVRNIEKITKVCIY